ncbi:hypothetical protein AHiyo8_58360 [Arthrobacter sp. Hiyo8]|nr:hypothetical protein AHiyo8_58360 [Arthrobacter sp. Hiyo8]
MAACGELRFYYLAALFQRGLVGDILLQRPGVPDEIIGQQPGLGVADVELHGLGAAGDFGLLAQRRELTTDFRREVTKALQVRLHGFQLADGLFLATPMLEDTCGFFNESPAVLGVACRTRSNCPCPTITCISRPRPESESNSWMSRRRQGDPLMAYSDPPVRKSVREMVTSLYSIGRAPSALSIVRATCARPSGGRPDVPAKMTSSILPPRRVLAPCSPMTQASASTTLDLPEPLGPTTAVTPGSKSNVVADANDLNPRTVKLFRCKVFRISFNVAGGYFTAKSTARRRKSPDLRGKPANPRYQRPLRGFGWQIGHVYEERFMNCSRLITPGSPTAEHRLHGSPARP